MRLRAQGTIEYLVVLAIVIVISLVVVGIVSSTTNPAQITTTAGRISNLTNGGIGIADALVGTDGNGLISLQNNSGGLMTITRISLGGVDNNYSKQLTTGTDSLFSLANLQNSCYCSGNVGSTKTCAVIVYYTTQEGLEKKETYSVTVDCATTAVPADSNKTTYSYCNVRTAGGYFFNGSGTAQSPYGICDCNMLQNINQNTSANYILLRNIDCSDSINWFGGAGTICSGSYYNSCTGTAAECNTTNFTTISACNTQSGCTAESTGDCHTWDSTNRSTCETDHEGCSFESLDCGEFISSETCYANEGCVWDGEYSVCSGSYYGTLCNGTYYNACTGTANACNTTNFTSTTTCNTQSGCTAGSTGDCTELLTEGTCTLEGCTWNGLSGFGPVNLSGSLNGNNYTISSLYVYRPAGIRNGLFGTISGSVSNLGIIDQNIMGNWETGGLAGRLSSSGVVTKVYTTGTITGLMAETGGLVGYDDGGTISKSYSGADVNGGTYHSSGGLIGLNIGGTVSNSYSTGDVVATGQGTGGLIGLGQNGSIVLNSFSTGNVQGHTNTGGLIGTHSNPASSVTNSFAAGNTTSSSTVGGFIGSNTSTITNAYWNKTNSLNCYHDGNTNCTAIDNNLAYFYISSSPPMNAWDFTNIWQSNSGAFPTLK